MIPCFAGTDQEGGQVVDFFQEVFGPLADQGPVLRSRPGLNFHQLFFLFNHQIVNNFNMIVRYCLDLGHYLLLFIL